MASSGIAITATCMHAARCTQSALLTPNPFVGVRHLMIPLLHLAYASSAPCQVSLSMGRTLELNRGSPAC